MKPDFIGIGGQRCGTAWIYNCLEEHPSLCLPFKEINYFTHAEKLAKGDAWYKSHFQRCQNGQFAGEISSLYLYDVDAPKRIHEYNPEVKLLVSLRNPVDRAFSSYQNNVTAGQIAKTRTFEEALDEDSDILEKSFYSEPLQRFLDCFPKERLLVLVYEEGLQDPQGFIQSIYGYVGVDAQFYPSMAHQHLNVGRIPRSILFDRGLDTMGELLRRMGLQSLIRWLKGVGLVGALRRTNTGAPARQMSLSTREYLERLFAPDVRKVAEVTGKDLSIWFDYEKRLEGQSLVE